MRARKCLWLMVALVAGGVLLATPQAGLAKSKGKSNGVPFQIAKLKHEVHELSTKVDEISDALAAMAADEGTPIQLRLRALFEEGDINAAETILGPISFTVPEGMSMLIQAATCVATRGVSTDHQFDISLDADFVFTSSASFGAVVQFVPVAVWESPGPFGDRAIVSVATNAYVNIPSPAEGAPSIGDTLLLRAQRNGTEGTGGVDCTVSGVLFPRPPETP